MNRQTRTLIVLVVALVAAGAASYGVFMAIARMPVRQVEVATRHAVVAAKALPVGSLITPDTVKVVAWPAAAPLEGGFDPPRALVSCVGAHRIPAAAASAPASLRRTKGRTY